MSQANIKSFRVLNNEDVMMGVLSYLCQVEPMDLPGLKLLPHNNNNLSSSAIIGEVNDGKTMHCLWESVHGKPCDINDSVDCGQHVAKDCSSCPQGNGAEQDRCCGRTRLEGGRQAGNLDRSGFTAHFRFHSSFTLLELRGWSRMVASLLLLLLS